MNGKPAPLPWLLKQKVVREHARRFGLRVLIETGTYMGDMIAGVARAFDEVYSIELDDVLYARAQRRFQNLKNVRLLHGDSARLLPDLLSTITRPCLFWLDAHYCGGPSARSDKDTPIEAELRSILSHPIRKHVILIDDAADFDGSNDYPTVDQLRHFVEEQRPDLGVEVADQIIRIHERDRAGVPAMAHQR